MATTSVPAPRSALLGRAFAGVLLDLDGTLVDSIASVERSWRTWAAEYGVDPARLRHGVTAANLVAELLPPEQRAAAHDRIVALEVADVAGITLLPGAAELLDELGDGGARVAIVTSGSRPLAEARLAATGLRRPDVVVTADDVVRGKPGPEPYLVAARELDVEPADCVAVEDALAGLVSARDAGVGGALAVTTTTPADELAALADAVVGGLDEVRATVDRGTGSVRLLSR
ncbi:MAG TPA: HAD-IA family hydrolase [Dermatophilaceae bacterium]|nr:HAD-IA family hydrolase [Dermatophilaceae bacterium]